VEQWACQRTFAESDIYDEIRIQQRRITIRGSYSALALAHALSTKKLGHPEWVPSFGGIWLPMVDEFRNFLMSKEADIVLEDIKDF